tara:strand:+ start:9125 stop:9823 length:699 start_codon:yes stop_codon:yes gene_type:complete
MKKLTIAIDGHASTGKSSIAKELAKIYGYVYINSGSMYRAVTLFVIENELFDIMNNDINLFIKELNKNPIEFIFNNDNMISEIYLNKKNIEKEINSLEISKMVSKVAAIPKIRKEMVKIQRDVDRNNGVVMDGRDIGSIVFPDADIKLFLTASSEVRANRRYNEMIKNGEIVQYKDVLSNIKERDMLDSSRKDSPLIIAKNAIVIDNSDFSIKDQLIKISSIIDKKLNNYLQ